MAEIKLAALSSISFEQDVETNIKWQEVLQSIIFVQALRHSPIVLQAFSRIWYQQHSEVTRSIYNLQVESILSFNQQANPRDYFESIWHPMVLVQEVEAVNTKGPVQSMGFSQNVTYELVKYNPKDTVTFIQTVNLNIEKTESIEHVLELQHGATVYKPSKIFILS